MIDLRQTHDEMRLKWIAQLGGVVVVATVQIAFGDLVAPGAFQAYAPGWFVICGLALLACLVLLLTLRPMIVSKGGLHVDGKMIPWSETTAPKLATITRIGRSDFVRVWVTTTDGFGRDYMIVAPSKEIATMMQWYDESKQEPKIVRGSTYRGCSPVS